MHRSAVQAQLRSSSSPVPPARATPGNVGLGPPRGLRARWACFPTDCERSRLAGKLKALHSMRPTWAMKPHLVDDGARSVHPAKRSYQYLRTNPCRLLPALQRAVHPRGSTAESRSLRGKSSAVRLLPDIPSSR